VNRTSILLVCLIALVVGWVAYSRFSSPTASAPASLAPEIEGSKLFFVPVGDFPSTQLEPLVQYYRQKYNLEIAVLKSIPVDPATRDQSRQQLMAEKLVASVRDSVPEHTNDSKAILIGFTSEDIYPTSQGWEFAFGWRLGTTRTAVVSTARMNLHYGGEPSDVSALDTRMRKVVTKDIGILYYGLPQSKNPKSVLYNQILGIQELDQVGEDF
jgi:predicted Zn-dependent protease